MIYWHVLANSAEARLRAWIVAQDRAAIAAIARRGFPVLLRFELTGVSYARETWSAATTRADLHVQMLNPAHIKLEAKAPIVFTRVDGVSTLTAAALIGSWRSAHGELAMAGVEADRIALDDPSREGALTVRKLVINARPDARAAGEYQIAFEVEGLALPKQVRGFEGLGLEIANVRAAIVAEQAAALFRAAPQDRLGPWRQAGGQIRFEALSLRWGALVAAGSGSASLDSERRLQGALALEIERPAPVFAALAEGAEIDADARSALRLLAAGYALSGDDIEARCRSARRDFAPGRRDRAHLGAGVLYPSPLVGEGGSLRPHAAG